LELYCSTEGFPKPAGRSQQRCTRFFMLSSLGEFCRCEFYRSPKNQAKGNALGSELSSVAVRGEDSDPGSTFRGALGSGIGNAKALTLIKKLSPVAWRHIHLNGHYTFRGDGQLIDLDAILAGLELG
jgi:hypothetical protein